MHSLNLKSILFTGLAATSLVFSACERVNPIDPDITTVIDCNGELPLVWKDNPNLDVDYLITCELVLGDGQHVVVEPGVTIQFDGLESGIYITEGSLKMIGNSGAPITLEGKTAVKGSWKGIFYESNNLDNRMEFVTVRHAGSEQSTFYSERCGVALSSVFNNARLSVKNCTFTENDGVGLLLEGNGATLAEFASNTFTRNSDAPLMLTFNLIDKLDAASVYTLTGSENGKSYIRVATYLGGGTYLQENDFTLRKLGLPYRFNSEIYLYKKMTVEAGTELEFEQGGKIRVDETAASLVAVGTPGAPIIFRGHQNLPGSWHGIYIASSSPGNRLENCIIQNGGEGQNYYESCNLEIGGFYSTAVCTVRNCTISNSSGYGIAYNSASPGIVLENNSFSGNALGDLKEY